MLKRDEWLDLARKLDWEFSYVSEREVYPEAVAGKPFLDGAEWRDWDEPYRTSYVEYVTLQSEKDAAIHAVRDAVGRIDDYRKLDPTWRSAVKLHGATLPLAEFAAAVGNARAARFGRDSAWRNTALLGALDEMRHTQVPLQVLHDLVRWDRQFDWTHKFFHTNDWVAIAARHLVDELLLVSNPIEFAIATNFVFETGFTNLQFVGLSSVANTVGDRMFEKMVQSIQTDEARHSQIGSAVLRKVMQHDPGYAQALVDKWFWRTWQFFAIVTGFAMDYLTPVEHRRQSFKEFVYEWIVDQFDRQCAEYGLARPYYFPTFFESLDHYHHMAYASAYTYRATVWFDMPLPGPKEREWLCEKYPSSFPLFSPIWDRVTERSQKAGPNFEWYTHGATPIGFCSLCQLVLAGGTPLENSARVVEVDGQKRVFCSEPCERIFIAEKDRYMDHKDVVQRILAGEAPANLLELLRAYFGLPEAEQGKDVARGRYDFLRNGAPRKDEC